MERVVSLGQLVGEPLFSTTVAVPYDLTVIDTLLVILCSEGEFVFEVYSTNTFNLQTRFGKRGKGPSEFIEPYFMGQKESLDELNQSFYIFDRIRRRISKIPLKEALSGECEFEVSRLPTELPYTQMVFHFDQDLIVSKGDDKMGRFQIVDRTSDKTISVGYFPEYNISYDKIHTEQVYRFGSLCINPHVKEIAISPYYFGNIDFFDYSGRYLRSIRFSDIKLFEECLRNDCFSSSSQKLFIYDMELTNNIFHGLNVNNSPKDIVMGSPGNSKIIRFSWDGSSLEEYELDQYIDNFTFDKSNNCFFAISEKREDTPFLRFQIPASKK